MAEAPGGRLRVAAAVVWREGRLLLTRRPPGGPLGGLWEFPGGKLETGETPEDALVRELREELGVGAAPREVVSVERHDYAHGLSVELHFVRCELDSLEFRRSPEVSEVGWFVPAEVDPAGVLEADRGFLARLAASGDPHARG